MILDAKSFVELRQSQDANDCYRVAREPASEEVWLEVIEKYPDMRRWVAHNKTVEGKILDILSRDSDYRVRLQVAERRAAGEEILSRLAHDPKSFVRLTVLRNPKVSKEIIMLLANDKLKYVRDEAKQKLTKFT